MIVNDTSIAVSERHHNLERHLWSSIMLLMSSVMLPELSNTLLENIHSTGVTHDDCHMMTPICLKYRLQGEVTDRLAFCVIILITNKTFFNIDFYHKRIFKC
jgi:hypothetical protein